MESILTELSRKDAWEAYYAYKTSGICKPSDAKELRRFIDDAEYIHVCREIADTIEGTASFPLPRKAVISKMSSQKKRTVYIYPRRETVTVKFLTYLVLRRYDHIFCDNLYSFRPDRSAKTAVNALKNLTQGYTYKVDISNYFNSVDVGRLLPRLKDVLSDDPLLYEFLRSLLTEKKVIADGSETEEEKGIMAGTPIACFYANLFLTDMDRHFIEAGVPYARYSDDIIVFSGSPEELSGHEAYIKEQLAAFGLTVNPDKEERTVPGQAWTFLGFTSDGTTVDIAPKTVEKLKGKMRRKARSLMRWADRNEVESDRAAKAFIRIFNRKLLDISDDHDLTWSYWFFSVINTDRSLKVIDSYAQDTIRFIASGKRTKARYNVRYEDMKKWGYKSLVAEYHDFGKKVSRA